MSAPGAGAALIVVDLQYDFCPGGALAVPDGDSIVPAINRLARAFGDVVLTQDWHPPGHLSFASSHPGSAPYAQIELPYGPQTLWPDHCVQGSRGAELHAGLDLPNAALTIRKGFRADVDSYSAFMENDRATATGLAGYLRERGLRRLWFCGLALDFCVAWSALDARRLGFEATAVEDACRAIDIDGSRADAMRRMREAGVAIVAAESVVAEAGAGA